jgi:ABC-type sugar transport system permease subunit
MGVNRVGKSSRKASARTVMRLRSMSAGSSATMTAVNYIYNTSFKYFKFGYGAALSMVLLVILGILSYFQFKLLQDPTE